MKKRSDRVAKKAVKPIRIAGKKWLWTGYLPTKR